jgi:hypothetical protein
MAQSPKEIIMKIISLGTILPLFTMACSLNSVENRPNHTHSPDASSGKIALPLTTIAESGTQYRLDIAFVSMYDRTHEEHLYIELNGEDEVELSLRAKSWEMNMDPDWALYRYENNDYVPVDAQLLSVLPMSFDIVANETTHLTIQFQTMATDDLEDEIISFESGDLEVNFEVEEISEEEYPTCGNGELDEDEEYDDEDIFLTAFVDDNTCRWDFSDVEQLYCNGTCSWAGEPGCDQADADILCKLITDDPSAVAVEWMSTSALDAPGFPCTPLGFGTNIDVDRGINVDVSYQDSSILQNHGSGQVIALPDCITD